ncbi:MAG TPA: calcium/sodium antiporter [Myxococcota bacterium]|nr:calcium/sodium antiporter [Myxococcota bacterium]
MLIELALGTVGIAMLVGGGEFLVKGAASLARSAGISPLLVGLTVVAFGTSTPELAVSVEAALEGSSTLAFGNIFGSNMANIGLIIGLAATLRPLAIDHVVARRELPMMLLALAAAIATAFDVFLGESTDAFARSDGVVLLLFFFVFLYYTLGDLARQRNDHRASRALAKEMAEAGASAAGDQPGEEAFGVLKSLGLLALGLSGLIYGASLVVDSAVDVARALGVPEVAVGLTLVAVGTSIPELVASLVAIWRNNLAIAVGGIVGSNIFNTLLVTGVTAAIRPMPIPAGGHLDLAATAALSLLLFLVSRTPDQRIVRREGLCLLALWSAYVSARFFYLEP